MAKREDLLGAWALCRKGTGREVASATLLSLTDPKTKLTKDMSIGKTQLTHPDLSMDNHA